eukprot:TRINITY_DN12881_c0_g1_i1.p1 TRINITY_DN12881_c0_g1~~TRINITY_DN12881_c0_g1_i1.p1  ORF type:complete len:125 (+),score=10.35 TRINITY_DN12881_c0_g1_i1:580-954(+)
MSILQICALLILTGLASGADVTSVPLISQCVDLPGLPSVCVQVDHKGCSFFNASFQVGDWKRNFSFQLEEKEFDDQELFCNDIPAGLCSKACLVLNNIKIANDSLDGAMSVQVTCGIPITRTLR